jgi:hypothetical protein
MKRSVLMLGLTAWLAGAGLAQPPLPVRTAAARAGVPAAMRAGKGTVALGTLSTLETGFDGKLASFNVNDPIDLLGRTRGIYLDGYGVVFTTEISLIVTPSINPFHPAMTPAEIAAVHKRKLARVPALPEVMKEMVRTAAKTLQVASAAGAQIPYDQQVVVAFRLLYLPWEDTSGLPGMLIAKADFRSALNSDITIEEQR